MPDILTGEEELEVSEAVQAFEAAIARLDPVTDAAKIQFIQEQILAPMTEVIEEEIPTPLLCTTCNDPAILPKGKCPSCGSALDANGRCINPPAYLPLGGV